MRSSTLEVMLTTDESDIVAGKEGETKGAPCTSEREVERYMIG